MCFITDFDWYAGVIKEGYVFNKNEEERCDECGQPIAPGDRKFEVAQREHELCRVCEFSEEDEYHCSCEAPDYGETFEYARCMDCDWFLAAVKVAELEAGCSERESEPPLAEMVNAVQDGGRHEAAKYFAKAEELYPELVSSGYLSRMRAMIFYDDDE